MSLYTKRRENSIKDTLMCRLIEGKPVASGMLVIYPRDGIVINQEAKRTSNKTFL